MVSAPYPLQLHPTFSVPRLSLFLADRRCSCAPPTAVSLARTATCSACQRLRGSLGLDHGRSSRDATLAWLSRERGVAGSLRSIRSAVYPRVQTMGKPSYEARASDGRGRPREHSPARSPPGQCVARSQCVDPRAARRAVSPAGKNDNSTSRRAPPGREGGGSK